MLTYPNIDPVALDLGVVKVHWYGVMYLIGFAAAWWLGTKRSTRPDAPLNAEQVSDMIFYGALGVILGGRIGYVVFYKLSFYIQNPLDIIKVWDGGMSFHGGLIGVLVAMILYSRKLNIKFFALTDFLAPLVPVGFCTVRIGNFINGELWGGPGNVPWAMQVPCSNKFWDLCQNKLQLPANASFTPPLHPTQLYEALLEGLVLFLILWFFSSNPRPRMAVSGLFLICYGLFRFSVEFVRMPDAHLGYLAFGWVTMGQVLSSPMIIGGIVLVILAYRKKDVVVNKSV